MDINKVIAGVAFVGLTIGSGLIYLASQPSVTAGLPTTPRVAQTVAPVANELTPSQFFAAQCRKNIQTAIRAKPQYYKGSRATSTPADVCDCAIESLARYGMTDDKAMDLLIWMDANHIGPVSQHHVATEGKTKKDILAEKRALGAELSSRAKRVGILRFPKMTNAIKETRRTCTDLILGL